MTSSVCVTLVALVTMAVVTVWFGNFVFRAIDVLYKPSIKKWIRCPFRYSPFRPKKF
jgi:hypothetical protein